MVRPFLYIGRDTACREMLRQAFSKKTVTVDDFYESGGDFTTLNDRACEVVIVDGDMDGALEAIETVRASVSVTKRPYVLLVASRQRIEVLKKHLSMRNYPDDICSKSDRPATIANHVLFSSRTTQEGRRADSSQNIITRGDLRDTSYGRVLCTLLEKQFNGQLIIESPPDKAYFTLIHGRPTTVMFNRLQNTLGRMLLRKGIITEDVYVRSLELMLKENIKHGDAMVRLGVIKPSDLVELIKEQHREKLMFFFSKTSGQFLAVRDEGETDNFVTPKIDIFGIIHDGVHQYAPASHLIDKYLAFKNCYVALNERYTLNRECLRFNEDEFKLLDMIEETPLFSDMLGRTDFEFTKVLKMFEVLDCLSMVSFEPSHEKAVLITESAQPRMMEVRETIMRDYIRFKDKNYYQVLDIQEDAKPAEIKKRYIDLVKRFHPDRFGHLPLSGELKGVVSEIFQTIQMAYETLSDPESRTVYDSTLHAEDMEETLRKSSDIISAEIAFKKGEIMLKARKFADAAQHLRESVAFNDREPEYLVALAIALVNMRGDGAEARMAEAKKHLDHAAYLNPYLDKTFYWLGLWHKQRGDVAEAVTSFRKAVHLNPHNSHAIMELKELDKL